MKHHLKYISYVYDSPLVTLYSYTLINSCNYVFLFDKATYLEFHNAGIPTVYYLPLAANVSRLSAMKCPDALLPQVSSDVSFVGSLYNEEHNLFERLNGLSDYTRGYLDSIMLAQQKVYGYFFLEDLLTPPILEDLQAACPYADVLASLSRSTSSPRGFLAACTFNISSRPATSGLPTTIFSVKSSRS